MKYSLVAFAALVFVAHSYAAEVQPVSKETNCIALAIQREAGGESMKGMRAVGHVIVNRANSGLYPNDVCKVVFEKHGNKCQFSWVCSKHYSLNISEKALLAAQLALSEPDITYNAISFHVTRVHPKWHLNRTITIGSHVFYAFSSKSRQISRNLS